MGGVIFLLFCAIFVASLLAIFKALSGSGNRRSPSIRQHRASSVLAPVRTRYGAENLRASRLGELNVFRPALVFDYGRTMVRLKHSGSRWRKHHKKTTLSTDFLLPDGQQISIVSSNAANEHPRLDNHVTGDDEFDRQFFVYTNDPLILPQLLTDPVKWKMYELKTLQHDQIRFDVAGGHFETSCNHWFPTGQSLLDFVQGGLDLYDLLMLHNAEGLEFTDGTQVQVMADFRCPICSDEVMQDMVVCKRCKTPHCAECWEYNGKCAMFACMEERCIRVAEQEV